MPGKPYLLILLTIAATSCKIIGDTFLKPIAEVFSLPLTNPDLMHLQMSLLYHKQTYHKWPGNVQEMVEATQRDSIDVEFTRFKSLQWHTVGDSLLVQYTLQYEYADTIPYNYVSGTFSLFSEMNKVYASHTLMKGERKDGTWRFESNAENKKSRGKQ